MSAPLSAELLAAGLVARGAVLTIPGMPSLHFLVGDFTWLDERRVFWFTANGEDEFAGHVLEFDTARAPHALGVEFMKAGELVGYLTTIAESDVADPKATLADWRAWQTIAGPRRSFIDTVRESLTS